MSEQPGDPNDWGGYRRWSKEQRRYPRQSQRAANPRFPVAVVLIAVGVLLFLGNLGIVPVKSIWIFWPVLPIVLGAGRLSGGSAGERSSGLLAIVVGVVFSFLNLGWLHLRASGDVILALILIAIGAMALLKITETQRGQTNWGRAFAAPFQQTQQDHERSVPPDFVLLGGLKRRVDAFTGGGMVCILGNIEMDLRGALIGTTNRTALLNALTVFGAIKLRVPPHWRVQVRGASVLANFEDKTVPSGFAVDMYTLIITGISVLGSIEIEN